MIAAEVAKQFGVSQGRVRQLVAAGILRPSIKMHARLNWFNKTHVSQVCKKLGYPKPKKKKQNRC